MPVIRVCAPATLQKMVREVLPPDIRIAGDAIDIVIECCSGATNLASCPVYVGHSFGLANVPAILNCRSVACQHLLLCQTGHQCAQSLCSWCRLRPMP